MTDSTSPNNGNNFTDFTDSSGMKPTRTGVNTGPAGNRPRADLGNPSQAPEVGAGYTDAGDLPGWLTPVTATTTPYVGREDQISQTMTVLSTRRKRNAVILGDAGAGKTAMVAEIARRIATDDPGVPPALRDAQILELSLTGMLAGTRHRGDHEARTTALLNFVRTTPRRTVIFIDEIHTLVESDSAEQLNTFAQSIKPALADGTLSVLGATTVNEYSSFRSDAAMSRRFTAVTLPPYTDDEIVAVLGQVCPGVIDDYNGDLTGQAHLISFDTGLIPDLVSASESVSTNQPDSALTLFDTACAHAQATSIKLHDQGVLADNHPMKITGAMLRSMATKLLGDLTLPTPDTDKIRAALESVKCQEHVTADLPDILRRRYSGLFPLLRPDTWLFTGPSGTGKTATARAIADSLFDGRMINVNMAEFNGPDAVLKLFGTDPSVTRGNSRAMPRPFDPLKTNPYQVIILDEIDKAHPSVRQAMLKIFDEGSYRTPDGNTLDFSGTLIIATTNATSSLVTGGGPTGFDTGVKTTGNRSGIDNHRLVKELNKVFTPEFTGRFTRISAFDPLDRVSYTEVAAHHYAVERAGLIKRRPDLEPVLPVTVPDDLSTALNAVYTPDSGARPVRTVIRDWFVDHVEASSR